MPRKSAVLHVEGIGKRVRQLLLERDLQPGDIVGKPGLSKGTVYRVFSADELTRETAANLEAALGLEPGSLLNVHHGDASSPGLSPGEVETGRLARGAPRVAAGLPYEIRVWLQGFLLEITKAGATEEDVTEARELLTSPELFVYWSGGAPKEFTEADTLETMQAIADAVIRRALRKRGLKI